ncbi:MAG: hypothetical protein ACTHJ7_10095 [Candidatus Nitrosocosmicus sp.]
MRLYTSYLGNASNPIVIESVLMSPIFHHYKQLLQITKEVIYINEDYLRDELVSLLETKPEGKLLFYRFSKNGMVSYNGNFFTRGYLKSFNQ